MDKIILTGAAGFVGASIISKLKNKFKIVAIDDFSYGYKERLNDFYKDIQLVEGDVKDIKKLLEGADYKALINCAAVAPLPENQANIYTKYRNMWVTDRLCDRKRNKKNYSF